MRCFPTSRSPPTSPTASSTGAQAAARSPSASPSCLKLVGLPDAGAKYPGQLSGGQQQRIALARALATAPGLLLLDEPLSALDALERVRLRGEIRALQQRLGVTTVMVTHDQEEALSMADRIVVMSHGRIEQVGTPREVYEAPATPFVADFIGKINVLPAVAEGGGQFRVGGAVAGRRAPGYRRRHRGEALPAAGGDRAERHGRRRERATVPGATIAKVEFLGAFCMVGLALDAAGVPRWSPTCRARTSMRATWRRVRP